MKKKLRPVARPNFRIKAAQGSVNQITWRGSGIFVNKLLTFELFAASGIIFAFLLSDCKFTN